MAAPFAHGAPSAEKAGRDQLADVMQKSGFLVGVRSAFAKSPIVSKLLGKAEDMARKGAGIEDTHAATGWWQHPLDKGWRTEIPGNDLLVAPTNGWKPFNQGVDVPRLERAYPSLLDTQTNVFRSDYLPNTQIGGSYGYSENRPDFGRRFKAWGNVDPDTTGPDYSARGIMGHELQHGVQHIEGWGGGFSPKRVMDRLDDPAHPMHYFADSELMNRDAPETLLKWGYDPDLNWQKDLGPGDRATLLRHAAHNQYKRNSGEIEADNARLRLDFTPQQMAATPWWTTMARPFDEQWVARHEFPLPQSIGAP